MKYDFDIRLSCKNKNLWVRYSLKVLINYFMYLVVVVNFFNSVKNQMAHQGEGIN